MFLVDEARLEKTAHFLPLGVLKTPQENNFSLIGKFLLKLFICGGSVTQIFKQLSERHRTWALIPG